MSDIMTHVVRDTELMDLNPVVPIEVQIRQRLNSAGFRFEDDGKLSSIINRNPKPLGKFKVEYDMCSEETRYTQEIL